MRKGGWKAGRRRGRLREKRRARRSRRKKGVHTPPSAPRSATSSQGIFARPAQAWEVTHAQGEACAAPRRAHFRQGEGMLPRADEGEDHAAPGTFSTLSLSLCAPSSYLDLGLDVLDGVGLRRWKRGRREREALERGGKGAPTGAEGEGSSRRGPGLGLTGTSHPARPGGPGAQDAAGRGGVAVQAAVRACGR